ncbi:DUF397 domain-containing protein [Actinomadura sp. GTD37]|uniref:DUF397 domain-containing protein n=1 Tax=Actinomadura sp. GTD37 TaxID=1778030 RepID=UPI0035BFDB53
MTNWRKSSHSGGSATSDCVELARSPRAVGVRDSKDPSGPRIMLQVERFRRLAAGHQAWSTRPALTAGRASPHVSPEAPRARTRPGPGSLRSWKVSHEDPLAQEHPKRKRDR